VFTWYGECVECEYGWMFLSLDKDKATTSETSHIEKKNVVNKKY